MYLDGENRCWQSHIGRSHSGAQGCKASQSNTMRYTGYWDERKKITVTIDAEGKMTAKTAGLKGESCIEELEALLSELAELDDIEHTQNTTRKILV